MSKLWSGRFSRDPDKLVEDFHSSLSFDQKLCFWDIKGSIAHARMLAHAGILTEEESGLIISSLGEIHKEIESGCLDLDPSAEDIHMNIELLLTEKIGSPGKKLHTGRSRNDQVTLDMRMYLRHEAAAIMKLLIELMEVLAEIAREHTQTVLPGYTHLQRAQPVSLAHHLMAYFEMLRRDLERLTDCGRRINVLPLGSGALAGTTFPLDREMVAAELGFSEISRNSIDAVSDRDFIIEFTSAASVSMMHLSRMCEEIVLWSSKEFSFVELDDSYSTGSSIMPQKKNPDVAELVRGKTGRVYGNLMGILTVMKGLPLAYNKDMQEDKEGLFDTVDTWKKCLTVMAPMISTMKINKGSMLAASKGGFTNATDLADYLVKKGIPFRDAHDITGKLVAHCLSESIALEQVSLDDFRVLSSAIGEDVYDALCTVNCMNRRKTSGGTGSAQVAMAIEIAEKYLKSCRSALPDSDYSLSQF